MALQAFNFNAYERHLFLQHHQKNFVPGELSDEEFAIRCNMIAKLIESDVFEYVTIGPATFTATAEIHDSEVYNLLCSTFVLELLVSSGKYFNNSPVLTDFKAPMRCHAASALTYLLDKKKTIYTGISDGSNVHSWCIHEDTSAIHENTGITRESYFGIPVTGRYLKEFIRPLVAAIREIIEDTPSLHPHRDTVEASLLDLFGELV